MAPFRAACVQMRSSRSPAENVATAEALIREAAAAGAVYVQTPEMTNLLERDRAALFDKIALEEADQGLATLKALARELGITLHIGSFAIRRPTAPSPTAASSSDRTAPSPRATTRSTCSTSIWRTAKAGANPRPISRATSPW